MMTIPSLRSSKTNWLNFHRHHCSSSIANRFKKIIIRDSIAAGLNRYRSVWTKYLEPLKTLNCGIGGDRFQNVLWRAQNLPVISSLKNLVILCGTNNLFQDSPEDIADGVIEIAETFQSKYNSVNIAIGGILPRDASSSINPVLIKEVNEILKEKCSRLFFIYISYDSCWTVANGSLNPDLFFLSNVHLVEQGNLKLAESIFSSIETCNGFTCNNQKQSLTSSKMAVSFKLNNSDFPPLSFSTVSKPVSFVPVSLSFATACRSSRCASALSHKSLSDPTNACDVTVCSSSVYPSKPIHPSKPVCLRPVCLSNVRPSKPTISSNFYLSNLFVQEILVSVDLFVQVMLVKVEVMLFQVNLFVQVMFAQVKPFVQVMFAQVSPFVQAMLI